MKFAIAGLLIVIGLAVVSLAALLAWSKRMDRTNGTIVSSGITRRYLLYVPKSYEASTATPLIISIHGGAMWPALQMWLSGWNNVADQHGFIVVYPAGTGAFHGWPSGPGPHSWHQGPHCCLPQDLRFISDLIDKLAGQYNIDPNRIYVSGFSNGGAAAVAIGCDLSERIAAVGVVSPGAPPFPGELGCESPTPVPTLAFHGMADSLAPYKGGRPAGAPGPFPDIRDWVSHVARQNQCEGVPSETQVAADVRRLAYTKCAGNAETILYTIQDGGHTWPGGKHLPSWPFGKTTDEINADAVMWEFFARHPRGGK